MVAFFAFFFFPSLFARTSVAVRDGVGGGVVTPTLVLAQHVTAANWRPMRVAFSLGKSSTGDYWVSTNPVGGLGVMCI